MDIVQISLEWPKNTLNKITLTIPEETKHQKALLHPNLSSVTYGKPSMAQISSPLAKYKTRPLGRSETS